MPAPWIPVVRGYCLRRHRRTLIDPRAQLRNLVGGKRFAHRRHGEAFLSTRDALDEFTGSVLARLDYRTIRAAFEHGFSRVKSQTGHLLLGAVTALASGFKNWLNIAREIGFGRLGVRGNGTQKNEKWKPAHG
jgi:hypothetical protein